MGFGRGCGPGAAIGDLLRCRCNIGPSSCFARYTETRQVNLVGATRFERATSSTPWKRATKLRHAPTRLSYRCRTVRPSRFIGTRYQTAPRPDQIVIPLSHRATFPIHRDALPNCATPRRDRRGYLLGSPQTALGAGFRLPLCAHREVSRRASMRLAVQSRS